MSLHGQIGQCKRVKKGDNVTLFWYPLKNLNPITIILQAKVVICYYGSAQLGVHFIPTLLVSTCSKMIGEVCIMCSLLALHFMVHVKSSSLYKIYLLNIFQKICVICIDISLELVYVGWDFGDHHYDNSRSIMDYYLS